MLLEQRLQEGLTFSLLSKFNECMVGGDDMLSNLPTPYPLQSEILNSPAKRKVIACGRQSGKTMAAAMSAVGGEQYGGRGLLDGAHVYMVSPVKKQTNQFWEYVTTWLRPLFDTPGFYKNETERIIKYKGGRIQAQTAFDPDKMRSGNVDKIIMDECAWLKYNAWGQAGSPMLVARDGVAEFYSTPNRRNWFFQLFIAAEDKPRWLRWNFPTTDNPHLSQTALDMLTSDMTQEDYQQEILAQFLASGGAVFRMIDQCAILERAQPYQGVFIFGVDWAQVHDYTVIVVMDKRTKRMVDYDRFNQIDWALQRGRLVNMYEKWGGKVRGEHGVETIIAEANSIGGPNIEALQAEGLPVTPFMTTATSKPPLIESLILAIERHEVELLNDAILKGELMAYERKITATGRSQYSAPEGLYDDFVIATALSWHGVSQPVYGFGPPPEILRDFRG